jgi:hypothetical protein
MTTTTRTISTGHTLTHDTTHPLWLRIEGDTETMDSIPDAEVHAMAAELGMTWGGDVVDELSRRTGLSRDQVVAELARMLPNVVDKLTPDGRLPTRQEIMRLMS